MRGTKGRFDPDRGAPIDEFAHAWDKGQAMTLEEAIELAVTEREIGQVEK